MEGFLIQSKPKRKGADPGIIFVPGQIPKNPPTFFGVRFPKLDQKRTLNLGQKVDVWRNPLIP